MPLVARRTVEDGVEFARRAGDLDFVQVADFFLGGVAVLLGHEHRRHAGRRHAPRLLGRQFVEGRRLCFEDGVNDFEHLRVELLEESFRRWVGHGFISGVGVRRGSAEGDAGDGRGKMNETIFSHEVSVGVFVA